MEDVIFGNHPIVAVNHKCSRGTAIVYWFEENGPLSAFCTLRDADCDKMGCKYSDKVRREKKLEKLTEREVLVSD